MERQIETDPFRKGMRRSPKYYPQVGETCEYSGPNMDDMSGYVWTSAVMLWRDDTFFLCGTPGYWPVLQKWELALFRPRRGKIERFYLDRLHPIAPTKNRSYA